MRPRIDHIHITVEDLDRAERPSRRRAGALHHLAFRAEDRSEADRLCLQIQAIPGTAVVHPPQDYPDYAPDYYALFFKDSEGIEYEVVSMDRERSFPEEGERAL